MTCFTVRSVKRRERGFGGWNKALGDQVPRDLPAGRRKSQKLGGTMFCAAYCDREGRRIDLGANVPAQGLSRVSRETLSILSIID